MGISQQFIFFSTLVPALHGDYIDLSMNGDPDMKGKFFFVLQSSVFIFVSFS